MLQWKSNKCYILWVCVCSLRYPACNAHAPCYIVIWGLSDSTIFFPTLFHKRRDFQKKKVIGQRKCVLIFSTTSFLKQFLDLRIIQRDIITNLRRWLQHINRMPHNRLLGIVVKLQTYRQKKLGQNINETSRRERRAGVNKWRNYMLARWCWWYT